MFDLTFHIPTDGMMLSDWHRADDPWGAYLAGPGNPAHNLSNPQAETVYVPYGQGGPNVHGCESGTAGCYAKSSQPMLTEWHKTDDAWGAYLDGPGKGTPCNHTIYVPYGEGGPDVHACEAGSPGCYANSTHTSALGAGPEFYNNMEAPHNCVGGSEGTCIPNPPPVMDPSKTGMAVTSSSMLTNTHTSALGAGPEFYNNMGAPHNCMGGSEGTCIPNPPPVMDPSKTGMAVTSSSMLANTQPSMALAVPMAAPAPASSTDNKPLRASPAHLLLPAHAFLLAAIQGLAKGDLSGLKQDAVANTKAVTPVGGHYLSQLTSE